LLSVIFVAAALMKEILQNHRAFILQNARCDKLHPARDTTTDRMAARRKLDQSRDDLCAGELRKRAQSMTSSVRYSITNGRECGRERGTDGHPVPRRCSWQLLVRRFVDYKNPKKVRISQRGYPLPKKAAGFSEPCSFYW